MPQTLSLNEAADFLKIKPDTLMRKARKGTVPAANIGRWIFIEEDLIEYIRSISKGGKQWSSKEQVQNITIADSRSTERKLSAQLARPTKRKPKSLKQG